MSSLLDEIVNFDLERIRAELSSPARWQDLLDWDSFEWTRNTTPFSHWVWPIGSSIIYLVTVFFLRSFFDSRDRAVAAKEGVSVETIQKRAKDNVVLKWWAMIHNLMLTWLSLAMMLGVFVEVYLAFHAAMAKHGSMDLLSLRQGLYDVLCDPSYDYRKSRLMWWCYIFYASKYVELFDTLLLLLRRSDLIFLHWFHHAVVPFLFWWYMETAHTHQWVLVVANSFVHTPMYYYYYLAIAHPSYKPWWRLYITLCQIFQFVIDLTSSYLWVYWSSLHPTGCSGSLFGVFLGNFIGFSFLILFIRFYLQERRRSSKRTATTAAAAAKKKET